ncbi:OLC1v1032821C1 [Oldenlandia corymbosa var. corymbosa]|uniref:OLC1v1032821C1 n=1 Tax=Oldenlandia corymbosa var. corymbosa TaxID=529605 RepID=A0AAV1CNQ7_OLDCO|nr:OLC1v1032821C1 [Oldenlandia corymbosa var. corymbosa]
MAESQLKRQREDAPFECDENSKRHKQSYNQILSILEEEEEVTNQDFSDMFKTLQEEISSDSSSGAADPSLEEADHQSGGGAAVSESSSPYSRDVEEDGEEESRISVMRHLLEASDDELGLPSISESGDEETNSGENLFNFGDGLWEFEDDAANYYTLLQSELFL